MTYQDTDTDPVAERVPEAEASPEPEEPTEPVEAPMPEAEASPASDESTEPVEAPEPEAGTSPSPEEPTEPAAASEPEAGPSPAAEEPTEPAAASEAETAALPVPGVPAEPAGESRKIPVLDDVEIRVLGCLMEKQKTTPAYYPMTLNSLTAACNQKSSRDPVVDYPERTVHAALEKLRDKRLVGMVSTAGGHVPKYRHVIDNLVGLSSGEYALLCVLLLRGPQTVGQLRSRSERMHKFNNLHEVQETLNELANDHEDTLVTMLPREAGRKDHRYAHLLGDTSFEHEPVTASSQVPEAVPASTQVQELTDKVTQLEAALQQLREEFDELKSELNG